MGAAGLPVLGTGQCGLPSPGPETLASCPCPETPPPRALPPLFRGHYQVLAIATLCLIAPREGLDLPLTPTHPPQNRVHLRADLGVAAWAGQWGLGAKGSCLLGWGLSPSPQVPL